MSKGPTVHFAGTTCRSANGWSEVDAANRTWNEPDPDVVTLQDGRKVLRQFYDPLPSMAPKSNDRRNGAPTQPCTLLDFGSYCSNGGCNGRRQPRS